MKSSSLSPLWSRRSFLKAGIAATALPALPMSVAGQAAHQRLSAIPNVRDLAGSRLVHAWRDLYNSPTTQNEYGYVQASKSVSGITALSLPPYACCGIPDMPWSPGFLLTCELFLNGRLLLSYSPGGDTIAYQWFPHRFVRESEVDGLKFTTETFMPSRRRAAAQSIRVTNLHRASRTVTLGFDMRAAVAKKTTAWLANSPGEADNAIHWDAGRGALVFVAQHSPAVSVQGIAPGPSRLESGRMIVMEVKFGAGETREFHYVNAVDANAEAALAAYDELQSGFEQAMGQNEADFNRLLRAAFTEGNSDFSGHLPQLETNDESLWQLYHAGFKNLIFARRPSPDSKYGTTYITLGGHVLPTLSFPWDTSLTSLSLALLDPEALRRLVENWFVQDMHQHLATDYVSAEGVGPWYGVNDMAIVRCAENYLRVTGDFGWLDKRVGETSTLDHLVAHATYWKQLDQQGHGLGDYGKIENLLEVVSTYLHETAGMNAGNVSSMRFVADLLDRRGESARATQLRAEATALAERINQKLYVAGKGWWKCGQPDGSSVEVRHCYDFLSVLDNMIGDLSVGQKEEMNRFFWDELHSEYWMRALSPNDVDATWNIRPDHSWLGAYAAWPPATAKGLYKIDSSPRVSAWVKNLAKAGNQGPIGQAHFVETVFPPEDGAAYKCPNDAPYINDWCCIAGGGFTDLVIDTIFGANLTLFDGVKAQPRLKDFDADARLVNLRYQKKKYSISKRGAVVTN
jgi:TAT (twin-arginine translocation) pathway signal sequence